MQFLSDVALAADAPSASASAVPRKWSESRGSGDLVSNGTGYMGTNYNWAAYTYVGSDFPPGTVGSFDSNTGSSAALLNDELIPVVGSSYYTLSFSMRQTVQASWDSGTGSYGYAGFSCYDIDGYNISPHHYLYYANTDTTLAQQLKAGDTYIYLTPGTTANWYNGATSTNRYITMWNYVDGGGYTWPVDTYSRWNYQVWAQNGVDVANNRIALSVPWAGPTYEVGHPVANTAAGGTYVYANFANGRVPMSWTTYPALIGGGTTATGNQFRPGTRYIKTLILPNRTNAGAADATSKHRFGAVSLRQMDSEVLVQPTQPAVMPYPIVWADESDLTDDSTAFATQNYVDTSFTHSQYVCNIHATGGTQALTTGWTTVTNMFAGSRTGGCTAGSVTNDGWIVPVAGMYLIGITAGVSVSTDQMELKVYSPSGAILGTASEGMARASGTGSLRCNSVAMVNMNANQLVTIAVGCSTAATYTWYHNHFWGVWLGA